jgi:UDP-glucose-4-epimerase GalE
MRVLVTGGAGYIGSHVVQALESAGHSVVVLDRRSPRPGLFGPSVESIEADVRDAQALDAVLAGSHWDGVIHLAALKSVAASVADPAAYFASNVVGTLRLLEAMDRASVGPIVFSSSCAVYGTPDSLPIGEETVPHPENPYGESKLLVERMLPWFDAARDIRFLSLRYFNAAGAALDGSNGEDWREAVNLVPVVIEAALGRGRPVDVFGGDYPTPDGTAIRDYVHVVDLANAHLRALEHLVSGAPSDVVNLGTGRGSSVLEVIDAVGRAAGRPVPHQLAPRRPGDPAAVWADSRRAQQLLGWTAAFGLDEIVRSAVAWHEAGRPTG